MQFVCKVFHYATSFIAIDLSTIHLASANVFVASNVVEASSADDIAAIVEVYEKPRLGYELECTAGGKTEWLQSFAAGEIQLELVS